MDNYITISNFNKYQHYKLDAASNMIWFKWYTKSISDYKFSRLNCYTRWIYIGLICLATKTENLIPYDLNWILTQITYESNTKELDEAINRLAKEGVILIGDLIMIKAKQDSSSKEPLKNVEEYQTKSLEQKIVVAYKMLKGFNQDDREWDKLNFGRYMKSAKQLSTYFKGDWDTLKKCLISKSEDFNNAHLSWTLETVVKHAPDWKLKHDKKQGG